MLCLFLVRFRNIKLFTSILEKVCGNWCKENVPGTFTHILLNVTVSTNCSIEIIQKISFMLQKYRKSNQLSFKSFYFNKTITGKQDVIIDNYKLIWYTVLQTKWKTMMWKKEWFILELLKTHGKGLRIIRFAFTNDVHRISWYVWRLVNDTCRSLI